MSILNQTYEHINAFDCIKVQEAWISTVLRGSIIRRRKRTTKSICSVAIHEDQTNSSVRHRTSKRPENITNSDEREHKQRSARSTKKERNQTWFEDEEKNTTNSYARESKHTRRSVCVLVFDLIQYPRVK